MPERFPKNIKGDFYTTGSLSRDGAWWGECLACGMPEAEAPCLFAELTENNSDTYFVKQPVTEIEIKQALSAMEVCCVDAVRYGGRDKRILELAPPELCGFVIAGSGRVIPNPLIRMSIVTRFWKLLTRT